MVENYFMDKDMKTDRVFADKKKNIQPFEFNREVADVFDDMLNRSVPFYSEIITRQSQLAQEYYQDGSRIYDLGCSHGNLGILILNQIKKRQISLIGVDNSKPMIEKYTNRLKKLKHHHKLDLVYGDIEDIEIENASVVLINLTLQFLSIESRNDLIKKVFNGLKPNGIVLLTEKVVHESESIDQLQTRFYKSFKLDNGYSELEISQKRDALEKVLIPESIQSHSSRLLNAGFTSFDIWFKWFNFASMMAIKK